MWLEVFFRGLAIGLIASIPLGPIGVLCVQRTLSKNQRSGFVSGLGAATADTIFATIAFFSLSMVMSFIDAHITLIKAIGGMIIIIVGSSIFFRNPVVQIRRNRAGKSSLWQDYVSVLLITIANPAYILVFVALLAAFGLSSETLGEVSGFAMLTGVFAGGASWWFFITFIINLARNKFRPRYLLWINRISGAVIILLGFIALLSSLLNFRLDGFFG